MLQRYMIKVGFVEGPDVTEEFTANTLTAAMRCANNKYAGYSVTSVALVGLLP